VCLVASSPGAQQSPAAEPYLDADAYDVYSALPPQEHPYGTAKGALVILHETTLSRDQRCVSPHIPEEFQTAFRDFEEAGAQQCLLERNIRSDKPYEFVPETLIKTVLKQGS
jgi:hypothetical protein